MSKRWIKVKELSIELGVTSHAIIQRCRDEGHAVQNSVTRLRPDIERAVRIWFRKDGDDAIIPPPASTDSHTLGKS